jgi:hypothetical protein
MTAGPAASGYFYVMVAAPFGQQNVAKREIETNIVQRVAFCSESAVCISIAETCVIYHKKVCIQSDKVTWYVETNS